LSERGHQAGGFEATSSNYADLLFNKRQPLQAAGDFNCMPPYRIFGKATAAFVKTGVDRTQRFERDD
jgi:hypothetical protein